MTTVLKEVSVVEYDFHISFFEPNNINVSKSFNTRAKTMQGALMKFKKKYGSEYEPIYITNQGIVDFGRKASYMKSEKDCDKLISRIKNV